MAINAIELRKNQGNDHENLVETAKSLAGIIPADIELEEAREARIEALTECNQREE